MKHTRKSLWVGMFLFLSLVSDLASASAGMMTVTTQTVTTVRMASPSHAMPVYGGGGYGGGYGYYNPPGPMGGPGYGYGYGYGYGVRPMYRRPCCRSRRGFSRVSVFVRGPRGGFVGVNVSKGPYGTAVGVGFGAPLYY